MRTINTLAAVVYFTATASALGAERFVGCSSKDDDKRQGVVAGGYNFRLSSDGKSVEVLSWPDNKLVVRRSTDEVRSLLLSSTQRRLPSSRVQIEGSYDEADTQGVLPFRGISLSAQDSIFVNEELKRQVQTVKWGPGPTKIQDEVFDGVYAGVSDVENSVVAIMIVDGSGTGKRCNGVQYASRFVVTNAHCFRELDKATTRVQVYFGDVSKLNWGIGASPGSPSCSAERVSVPDVEEMDIAVVRISGVVPAPYDRAISPLDDKAPVSVTAKVPATLTTYWLTSEGEFVPGNPKLGKKYTLRHPQCHLSVPDYADQIKNVCCAEEGCAPGKPNILHKCDTEEGSSGAPLFDAQQSRVTSINRRGVEGSANCAVPAPWLAGQLPTK